MTKESCSEGRRLSQRLSTIRGGFRQLKREGYKQKLRMAAWTTADENSPRAGYRVLTSAKDIPGPDLFEQELAPTRRNTRRKYIPRSTTLHQPLSCSLQQRGPEYL